MVQGAVTHSRKKFFRSDSIASMGRSRELNSRNRRNLSPIGRGETGHPSLRLQESGRPNLPRDPTQPGRWRIWVSFAWGSSFKPCVCTIGQNVYIPCPGVGPPLATKTKLVMGILELPVVRFLTELSCRKQRRVVPGRPRHYRFPSARWH